MVPAKAIVGARKVAAAADKNAFRDCEEAFKAVSVDDCCVAGAKAAAVVRSVAMMDSFIIVFREELG